MLSGQLSVAQCGSLAGIGGGWRLAAVSLSWLAWRQMCLNGLYS
jgi:hypothetical protein